MAGRLYRFQAQRLFVNDKLSFALLLLLASKKAEEMPYLFTRSALEPSPLEQNKAQLPAYIESLFI